MDLPGSLHTNKIPVILGRYPLPRFFCRLSIVPLDMDNGTFNSSHTDVVEKVNFVVPASQQKLRWWKDPHSTWTEMALFWSLFTGGSFLVDFLKNEILGFDENLAVVSEVTCNNGLCCHYPRSVCVRTAPGNVNMVAYGKINSRLSPN